MINRSTTDRSTTDPSTATDRSTSDEVPPPTVRPPTPPAARRTVRHGGDRSALLRGSLRANAVLSVIAGSAMAIASDRVGDLLGIPSPGWVRLVGLAVVLFGLDVALLSTRPSRQLRAITPWFVAADAIWVGASAMTIALGWYSSGGTAIVAAMGLAVGSVGTAQLLGWRRIS